MIWDLGMRIWDLASFVSKSQIRIPKSQIEVGDKSEATFLLSYTSRWPESNQRPPDF